MSAELTLYSYKESGNSYKVRLLLAFLDVKAKIVELDFLNDEQHSPEFLNINPRGEVPTLRVKRQGSSDLILRDSAAILLWIAGKYGLEKGWYTSDLDGQA